MGRALLVVDLLRDFVEDRGVLYCGPSSRAIIPFVAAKVEQARRSGEPVLFLADRHTADDKEFEMFPPHCIDGSRGAEFCAEVQPRPDEIIIAKRRYSAFYGTDLDLRLRDLGADEIEIVGVCTNICVYFTAADARMRGYKVTVFRDGVASFDEAAHRFALDQMEKVLGVKIA